MPSTPQQWLDFALAVAALAGHLPHLVKFLRRVRVTAAPPPKP